MLRTSLQAWMSRNVEGPLEDLVGGPARLRIIVMLACILALDAADKATLGAVAAQLKPALHINNLEIGLLVAVTVASSALLTLPFGVLVDRFNRNGEGVMKKNKNIEDKIYITTSPFRINFFAIDV